MGAVYPYTLQLPEPTYWGRETTTSNYGNLGSSIGGGLGALLGPLGSLAGSLLGGVVGGAIQGPSQTGPYQRNTTSYTNNTANNPNIMAANVAQGVKTGDVVSAAQRQAEFDKLEKAYLDDITKRQEAEEAEIKRVAGTTTIPSSIENQGALSPTLPPVAPSPNYMSPTATISAVNLPAPTPAGAPFGGASLMVPQQPIATPSALNIPPIAPPSANPFLSPNENMGGSNSQNEILLGALLRMLQSQPNR